MYAGGRALQTGQGEGALLEARQLKTAGFQNDVAREGKVSRKTNETEVSVFVSLDGTGRHTIATGIGFFDHMLEQLSRHSLIDMTVEAKGDRHVDDHHTVEDTGIAIGQAMAQGLSDRRGITRYASAALPMDETLTEAAIDVSGRPFLIWNVSFTGNWCVSFFRQ